METNKIDFKPFDRVLVRDMNDEEWAAAFYDKYISSNESCPHRMIGYAFFAQCIPYEGNEHLLGTTNSPELKPWKPKADETYFSVLNCYGHPFFVSELEWDGEPVDEATYLLGNCFRTREEAQEVADKFNAMLKGKE